MTRDQAIADLIKIVRLYLDRMPRFVQIAIEAAIKRVEEADQ